MSRAVVIGTSSGVGRAVCRSLAAAGWSLVIVSRDVRDLEATAADLRWRFGIDCQHVAADISAPDWNVESFAASCFAGGSAIDALLVPAGGARDDDEGANSAVIDSVVATNFGGPAKLAAAFGKQMQAQRRGHIVLFSSIAAVVPRARNLAYSAAKAALETYARGLRHALSRHGISVSVLAPGYVDTPQAFGLKLLFPVSSPESVAARVRALLEAKPSDGTSSYFPRFWSLVTLVLRALPWPLYKRLQF